MHVAQRSAWLFRRYAYGGERVDCWEPYLDAKSVALRVCDVQPGLNRYQHGPIDMALREECIRQGEWSAAHAGPAMVLVVDK